MDCATADALAALLGEQPPLHAAMLEPPARLRDPHPARSAERTFYGTPYADHLETEHFTVNWWTASADAEMAARAAAALETAWASLVDVQGWTPPVSSDRYYLWVLLDPGLGGTTGFTTEYFTVDYPDGYPIIFLNPAWADDEAFWAALAAHEFAHTLQYAIRDFSHATTEESWYWEASATWSSELADPTVDGHQYCAAWYATQPDLRYDSYQGSHQYGLFVLNAWLDEHVAPGTMAATWALSAGRPDDTWDTLLAEATGRTAGDVWAGFTGAYGNDRLAESDLYMAVRREGAVSDGAGGTLPYLGTHYWYAPEAVHVEADGDVRLGDADEVGGAITVEAGGMFGVTALADDVTYTLSVGKPLPVEDTAGDSGAGDNGAGDSDPGDSDPGDAGKDTGSDGSDREGPGSCGCAARPDPRGWGLAGLLSAWALRARRRPSAPPL